MQLRNLKRVSVIRLPVGRFMAFMAFMASTQNHTGLLANRLYGKLKRKAGVPVRAVHANFALVGSCNRADDGKAKAASASVA